MPRKSPKNQAFGGTARQHDASEFLTYLMGVLDDELNNKRDKPDYQAQLRALLPSHLTEKEKDDWDTGEHTSFLNTQVAMRQEWQRQLNGDNSEIFKVFHGQEAWMMRCTKPDCGFVRKRFRPFPCIQLNFPYDYITGKASSTSISMMTMFRTELNTVGGHIIEGHICYKCKRESTCIQDRAITYMPEHLIVEFLRFGVQFDPADVPPGTEAQTDKLTTQVQFPETIDLGPLFIPLDPPPSGGIKMEHGQTAPFIYDCYAVNMHRGRDLQSGHYVAMTRSLDKPNLEASKWHRFNDQVVTETLFEECQRPGTTVTQIFLKRRKPA